MRLEGGTAYVQTAAEALAVCDHPDVNDVVIEDNAERIKMQRIIRSFK